MEQRNTETNLRVITLNAGYYVMSNENKGQEAQFVQYCKDVYPKIEDPFLGTSESGWRYPGLSACTSNIPLLLRDYNLCGLQEINEKFAETFIQQVKRDGNDKQRNFDYHSTIYIRKPTGENIYLVTIYDRNVMGEGFQILPERGDSVYSRQGLHIGVQPVYFPSKNLLFINIHVCGNISTLPNDLDLIFRQTGYLLSKRFSGINLTTLRILVVGDFNDKEGKLITHSNEGKLQIAEKQLRLHLNPKITSDLYSCCYGNEFAGKYLYYGDYIFDTTFPSGKYYIGQAIGYDREKTPMSYHDPIVFIEIENLIGKEYDGIVGISEDDKGGRLLIVSLINIDADRLFEQAIFYLKENNIDWNVRKPLAQEHGVVPHVSLDSNHAQQMLPYTNRLVKVRFNNIYHLPGRISEDNPRDISNWVTINVTIFDPRGGKYKCYGGEEQQTCHVSIAQEKFYKYTLGQQAMEFNFPDH